VKPAALAVATTTENTVKAPQNAVSAVLKRIRCLPFSTSIDRVLTVQINDPAAENWRLALRARIPLWLS
jgi:hypothetical protein